MADAWHLVGGDPKAVQAVWFNYGIGVTVDSDTDAVAPPKEGAMKDMPSPTQGLSKADLDLADSWRSVRRRLRRGHWAHFWMLTTWQGTGSHGRRCHTRRYRHNVRCC